MTVRFYSSIAQQTTLTASISAATTVLSLASTTGFPASTPFTLALDYGAPNEELVDVTNLAGLTVTVNRAVDGTSATIHNAGAAVRHVSSARDFADSRTHENSNTGVHGLAVGSAVVGTNDTQTLINKTLGAGTTISSGAHLVDPMITGTVTGAATYNTPTLTAPIATGGQQWKSGATVQAEVTASGSVHADSGLTATAPSAGVSAAVVKGFTGQTADIFDVVDSASANMVTVNSDGLFAALKGAQLVGDPSPSTGGVVIKAGPSSIQIVDFQNASGSVVGTVNADGTVQAADFIVDNPIAWHDNSNAFTWGTTTGLHLPTLGNAVKSYMWKNILGVMHVSFSLTFGSTTNFGVGATTADNWTFSLPGAYTAQTEWQGTNLFVGFGRGTQSAAKTFPMAIRIDATGRNFVLDTSGGFQDATAMSNAGAVDSISPFTWAQNNTVQFFASVPVTPNP